MTERSAEDIAEGLALLDEKRKRQAEARAAYEALPTCKDWNTRKDGSGHGLYHATPGCTGKVAAQWSGGVKCDSCAGWYCL